jgi:hypothetical protein
VANYLDFLPVLDRYVRDRPDGCVRGGFEMLEIAREAGLVAPGDESPANWAGLLVEHGYLSHGPRSMGDRHPEIPGRMWGSSMVQRYSDYRLTPAGRQEADRLRREAREVRTDAALGRGFPHLLVEWLTVSQRQAIAELLAALQAGLDADRAGDAIGAAKDLVEAACKIVLERSGQEVGRSPTLPTLFRRALEASGANSSIGHDLGLSLTAVVQRLAEARNSAGAGHGRAAIPERSSREALLSASAAAAVAGFLLALPPSPKSKTP